MTISCESQCQAPVANAPGSPRVSVVLATYNYGRYLSGALESALAQTMSDLEIIVIDDGSTDETKQVMVPYLENVRIRYYETEHQGQPAAKNAGIRLARAPLVAFLDADDLWLPTKLEKQLALFAASPAWNRELYQAIEQQMQRDYSPTYYFRVMRAEQLLALYRRDPKEFERLSEQYRSEFTPSVRASHRLSVWLRAERYCAPNQA